MVIFDWCYVPFTTFRSLISPKSTDKFRAWLASTSVNDFEVLRSTLAFRFLFLRATIGYLFCLSFWNPYGSLSLEPPALVDMLIGILGGLLVILGGCLLYADVRLLKMEAGGCYGLSL